jgi:UPF0755 protein
LSSRILRAFLAALLLLVAAAAGGGWYAYRQFDAPGPLADRRAVQVPRGGTERVAAALAQEGVLSSALAFEAAAWLTRGQGPLRAAELEFPAAASLRQVLVVLRAGRPVQHLVTIPEGLTARQVADLLGHDTVLTGPVPTLVEGTLLPETYAFERGATRAQIAGRAQEAMTTALARLWPERAPDLPLASPQDALTLASIVERETARPEERPVVAGVYLNRLRLGMKLQSDPTVVYGVTGGLGVMERGLSRAELDRDDPYNTYRRAGLPPGPIAMPGLASLRATLQPAHTDALFFVADGTGGHSFARSEDDHRRNVARWREIERARAKP